LILGLLQAARSAVRWSNSRTETDGPYRCDVVPLGMPFLFASILGFD
jgi:hypothetical protein